MKTITPLPHYSIRLPDDALQEWDEEVLSLWRDGDSTALQLSSRLRESGEQVSASQRLSDRMANTAKAWSPLKVSCDADCEVAAATVTEDEYVWWHIYLVIPSHAVYVTVSFPHSTNVGQWAVDAVKSIRFGQPVIVPV